MNQREKYIGIVTGAVLGLLFIDRVAIEPLWNSADELQASVDKAQEDLTEDQNVIHKNHMLNTLWASYKNGGLRTDASAAESQILNNVREWAQDSDVQLGSLRPERNGEKEKDFIRMTFRATGTGSMAQVGNFLYRIENAPVPVRITDLTITPRKENTDDLSITIGISTIYLPPDTAKREAQ